MSIWRYSHLLPGIADEFKITLGEGNTPLIRSRRIGPKAGLQNLFFKLESSNPTGSYKDRYAASAVAHVLSEGKSACLGTSSGNAGSAVAAYCAAAGIPCQLAIVDTAPEGKLRQMAAYGAKLYRIRDFGLNPVITDTVMDGIKILAANTNAAVQISAYTYSPLGMSGVQTISYEIAEQAGTPIQHVFSPSGGGGLTLAVAKGFQQLNYTIAVHCVQPEGNNTIAGPLRSGAEKGQAVKCTSTISGLQVGNIIDGDETLKACRASGGTGFVVSDEEIYVVQKRLALEEGIFCEPAGATALAGALSAATNKEIDPEDHIICLVTGSGFKDDRSFHTMVENCKCPRLESVEQFEEICTSAYNASLTT